MAGIPKRILALQSRRKRIRGFRRILRDHQRRSCETQDIDLGFIKEQHRYYQKLGLAPWAISEKPPLAIRKLWISRLVADFQRWHAILARHYPQFYLAVWLFEPDFGNSQVVAGIEENIPGYENAFGKLLNLPLPAAYQALAGMSDLHWTARAQVAVFWPDEFAEVRSWAATKPHWEFTTSTGDLFFAVQTGIVWIGESPK